jgi:hypothetical protein
MVVVDLIPSRFQPSVQSLGHDILLGPWVNAANLPFRRSFHDPENQILR